MMWAKLSRSKSQRHTSSLMIAALAAYGVQAERKAIYSDLELLRQFGLDIEVHRGKSTGYYVASRQFELPELKLLVDAVQSSRFITHKKSERLIQKLSALTSAGQAKALKRQIFIMGRAKTMNEAVYYNIDQIHHAINEGKKIAFRYFDYSVTKDKVFRKQGKLYTATPVALCWNADQYYLVTYSGYHGSYTHYRVDRMSAVSAIAEAGDRHGDFNIGEYAKRAFGMFNGEMVRARLSFELSLVNAVLDHFGTEIHMTVTEDGWFDVSVDVTVSPTFLGWIFAFGGSAVIQGPPTLVEAMKVHLEKCTEAYSGK